MMSGMYAVEDGDGKSRAPLYHFVASVVLFGLFLLSVSNKKAYRKPSSGRRLRIHRERRNVRKSFWVVALPKNVALFELRIAAWQCGVDITKKYISFDTSSEISVRNSIGDTVLEYLERDGDGIVAVKPNEDWVFDEEEKLVKVTKPGCKLNMAAFLLRIALDKSYADPAFGEKPNDLYLNAMGSKWWSRYVLYLQMLPYIIDYGVRGEVPTMPGPLLCVSFSFFMVFLAADAHPRFTYSAILTIVRKKDMLSFMNDLIYSDKRTEEATINLISCMTWAPQITRSGNIEWISPRRRT